MKIMKRRSICAHKKWKRLVNLPFTKSLHWSEHCTRHHFLKMNCRRRCWQTQFSSTMEFSNEMKLKLRLPPFPLTHLGVDVCFVYGFVVFYLWINSDIIRWQTRHTGLFQIPCLGSCPLSTNQKKILISFAMSMTPDTVIVNIKLQRRQSKIPGTL